MMRLRYLRRYRRRILFWGGDWGGGFRVCGGCGTPFCRYRDRGGYQRCGMFKIRAPGYPFLVKYQLLTTPLRCHPHDARPGCASDGLPWRVR